MMEKGHDPPRMRAGGQWTSSQCVQKVEEMLSRAIIHQEDLWGLLLKHSPSEESARPGEELAGVMEESTISPPLTRAMKVKLENSLDWCHLALCRLKEIIVHSSSYQAPDNLDDEDDAAAAAAAAAGFAHAPSLNVPSHLSAALRVSKENLSSDSFRNAERSHNEWSPDGFIFSNESSQMASRSAQPCDGEQLQESMDLIVPDGEHHQQGQRISSLPSLGFGCDWNMLAVEAEASVLPTPSPHPRSAAGAEAHQSSSSCPSNVPDTSENGAENENRHLGTKLNSRGLRPRYGPKRDREETNDKDTTVIVVFQELKPGDDTKKGIPDDGHRGWKKYGNKSIQNSTFCRGYYKCSMKDCRAKKMVQPTDTNPSIFEVTYLGNHTCSSTSRRRIRSRTSNSGVPQLSTTADEPATSVPASEDVLVQTKIARLLKHHTSNGLITESDRSTGDGNYDSSLQRPETSWPSPDIQAAAEEEEVPEIGNAADSKEACSLEDDDDESSRDEQLGFAFPPDPLLWQDIMSSSHKEVWNSLQVEI